MSKVILWFAFLLILIIVGPIISIWALNTLFKLGIEYSIWTWLALAWLQVVLQTKLSQSKS